MRSTDSGELHRAMERQMNEHYGVEGWSYLDLPWIQIDYAEKILKAQGEDEYRVIAASKQGNMFRAQLLVSPAGIERGRAAILELREELKAQEQDADDKE